MHFRVQKRASLSRSDCDRTPLVSVFTALLKDIRNMLAVVQMTSFQVVDMFQTINTKPRKEQWRTSLSPDQRSHPELVLTEMSEDRYDESRMNEDGSESASEPLQQVRVLKGQI